MIMQYNLSFTSDKSSTQAYTHIGLFPYREPVMKMMVHVVMIHNDFEHFAIFVLHTYEHIDTPPPLQVISFVYNIDLLLVYTLQT